MKKMLLALAAIAVLGAAALYGTASAQHATAATAKAQLKARKGKLGTFLVDGSNQTLYLFEADKTSRSTCTGACAKAWPPALTSGKPSAVSGSGVKSSKIGTTKRADGTTQITYDGHPLYRFIKDTKSGDTKGEGSKAFGAEWYVLAPSGKKIDDDGGDDGDS
jgi:predicted lipoprotein with Yx(FWY)xxD motif